MTNASSNVPDGSTHYGQGDGTFQACGGAAGVRALVDAFYDIMSTDPRFEKIYSWHPSDQEQTRDKLALFLCAWMGGPRGYSKKYGSISIPQAHAHLDVTETERDQWLLCMTLAIERREYPDSLKQYLLAQLFVPADHIVKACEANRQAKQS